MVSVRIIVSRFIVLIIRVKLWNRHDGRRGCVLIASVNWCKLRTSSMISIISKCLQSINLGEPLSIAFLTWLSGTPLMHPP